MASVRSSVQGWNTAAAPLAVLIVIVLEALGWELAGHRNPLNRGSTRNSPSRKKSTQSRRRSSQRLRHQPRLSDYAQLLPSGFCDALGSLGTSDRWLDVGTGEGQAILDYYAPVDDAVPAGKCAQLAGRARSVAMSIEDRRTDKWQQQAASLGDDRISYLSAKACGTIRARTLENSRSLPTCTAASPIPKTCPSSWRRC
jgi:hypothetical protein